MMTVVENYRDIFVFCFLVRETLEWSYSKLFLPFYPAVIITTHVGQYIHPVDLSMNNELHAQ